MISLFKKAAGIWAIAMIGLALSNPASAQIDGSIDSAVVTATQWAAMADAGQADRMWDQSGPAMQKNISKDGWVKYLGAVKKDLGTIGGRQWVQIVRITDPPSLPPGEYINIAFSSRFAKGMAVEKISMLQTTGQWIPVGYIITKIDAGAAAPNAAKTR
ncbi:DUF4019 domain-containing protein [Collimonas humicola]|uniref:DUF4019 domain-containing protein n=1 Tax=Collimonas humicola TaxID=2825886 RepID=UPI001B8D60CB|nr:DUF4019 domain-containing protein [Collimonas humicola]